MRHATCFLILLIPFTAVKGDVRLPKIFSDHMVLQRNAPIKIWGWSSPGEKITVSFNTQTKTSKADKQGRWTLSLASMPAGGPYVLSVRGKNLVTYSDVMVGEVWLCSGQSNMEWILKDTQHAETEIASATYPMIRHFDVPNRMSGSPQTDVAEGKWTRCSPETAAQFTAVGYYFAKALWNELKVPVGLINATWGGTFIEAWMSYPSLQKIPGYEEVPQLTDAQLEKWFKTIDQCYQNYATKLGFQDPLAIRQDDAGWSEVALDDSRWISVPFPGNFDATYLPRFDGLIWFRTTVAIPQDLVNQKAVLRMGKIDDSDETYINGKKIGATDGQNTTRTYAIPDGLLVDGDNTLAIKITDFWETGGFTSKEDEIALEFATGHKILLRELPWKMNFAHVERLWIQSPNIHPNLLYNGMIHPIVPFTIKGALWYQGENNAEFAYDYRVLLPAMIADWRSKWDVGNFPFYFVQLPNYGTFNENARNGGSNWAEIRESFTHSLSVPNTGMAVILDIGDSTDIHPRNKADVGERLSRIAFDRLYNIPRTFNPPTPKDIAFSEGKATITFDTNDGLIVRDRYGYVRGFEIAGEDQQFHHAQAMQNGNTVVVYSPAVPSPKAVRYAWSSNPDGNLFSKSGLPVSTFRSDNWKLNTESRHYDNWIGRKYRWSYTLTPD